MPTTTRKRQSRLSATRTRQILVRIPEALLIRLDRRVGLDRGRGQVASRAEAVRLAVEAFVTS